jgi:transposase
MNLLDTIPGVARPAAEMIVAEIGTDMSSFPSADHVASWAGVFPGNHESAGKRTSGRTRKGNRFLRIVLVQGIGSSRTRRRADPEYLFKCPIPAARHTARQEARDECCCPFDTHHGLL